MSILKFLKTLSQSVAMILMYFFFIDVCQAGNLTLESGNKKVSLIELYSSEGCSSCPSAEKWLVELRGKKGLWTSFVPVEFHVDYWNQLGWVDPFSNTSFTQRQRAYSNEWGSGRIYTPGFVQDGKEWRRGGAIQASPSKNVGNLKVTQIADKEFQVEFRPVGKKQKAYRVVGAVLGNGLATVVPRGENIGKTLKHEFVVLSMGNAVMGSKKGKGFVAQIKFSKSYKAKPKSLSMAFWVTGLKDQQPIQAVGGDLPQPVKFAKKQTPKNYMSSLARPR